MRVLHVQGPLWAAMGGQEAVREKRMASRGPKSLDEDRNPSKMSILREIPGLPVVEQGGAFLAESSRSGRLPKGPRG